jgi:rRNA maturation endonuclease Nob1
MISLDPATLVFIYVMVFLASVLLLWVLSEMARRHQKTQSLRHRVRCTLCAMQYDGRPDDPLPRCPRCGSLNEHGNLQDY